MKTQDPTLYARPNFDEDEAAALFALRAALHSAREETALDGHPRAVSLVAQFDPPADFSAGDPPDATFTVTRGRPELMPTTDPTPTEAAAPCES